MQNPLSDTASLGHSEAVDAAEARVRSTRGFYQNAVAAYLRASATEERERWGEVMYFAQMATIEARFNPEGCARFRALAEARMVAVEGVRDLPRAA